MKIQGTGNFRVKLDPGLHKCCPDQAPFPCLVTCVLHNDGIQLSFHEGLWKIQDTKEFPASMQLAPKPSTQDCVCPGDCMPKTPKWPKEMMGSLQYLKGIQAFLTEV